MNETKIEIKYLKGYPYLCVTHPQGVNISVSLTSQDIDELMDSLQKAKALRK